MEELPERYFQFALLLKVLPEHMDGLVLPRQRETQLFQSISLTPIRRPIPFAQVLYRAANESECVRQRVFESSARVLGALEHARCLVQLREGFIAVYTRVFIVVLAPLKL